MAEKKGLFGKPHPPAGPSPEMKQVMQEINTVSRRLRMLEERLGNIHKKIEVVEGNILDVQKKIHTENSLTQKQLVEHAQRVSKNANDINTLVRELQLLAKKEDIDILTKYIDHWNPLQFITMDVLEHHLNKLREELKK